MTQTSLSLLNPAALTYGKAETDTLEQPAIAAMRRPVSSEMLRVANRLTLALRPKELLIAVTGVCEQDPSAKFAEGLALALAHLGNGPVLYVDASMDGTASAVQPAVSPEEITHLLSSTTQTVSPVASTDVAGLHVLTLSRREAMTPQVVGSEQMDAFLDKLRSYRLVILNVGSVVSTTESMLLAAKVDAIVAVATTGDRTKREVDALRSELSLLRARFIGLVLAGVA